MVRLPTNDLQRNVTAPGNLDAGPGNSTRAQGQIAAAASQDVQTSALGVENELVLPSVRSTADRSILVPGSPIPLDISTDSPSRVASPAPTVPSDRVCEVCTDTFPIGNFPALKACEHETKHMSRLFYKFGERATQHSCLGSN